MREQLCRPPCDHPFVPDPLQAPGAFLVLVPRDDGGSGGKRLVLFAVRMATPEAADALQAEFQAVLVQTLPHWDLKDTAREVPPARPAGSQKWEQPGAGFLFLLGPVLCCRSQNSFNKELRSGSIVEYCKFTRFGIFPPEQ